MEAVGELIANRTATMHQIQRPVQNFITYH